MTVIFLIIGIFVTLGYAALIYSYANGLRKSGNGFYNSESLPPDFHHSLPYVSVIIAARNEEKNIEECLRSLGRQHYPVSHYEIIIVDDHSEDMTTDIINRLKAVLDLEVILVENDDNYGKKAAIKKGILSSRGKFLLFTDADCRVSPDWILSMTECFIINKPVFITGPVMLSSSKGFFNAFQRLEFSSLIASTAGSIAVKKPVMANGANMAFSKPHYLKMLEEKKEVMGEEFTSGDDVFTLFSVKQHFGTERITFLNSLKGAVFTSPKENLKALLEQRFRWVSKSRGYKDKDAILTAVLIFGCNFMILLMLLAGLYNICLSLFNATPFKAEWFVSAVILLAVKSMVDYYLLIIYVKRYNQTQLLKWFPVAVVPVMLFTVISAILGNLVSVKWKKRRVN